MAGSYLHYPMYLHSPFAGYGSTTSLITGLIGVGLTAGTAIYQIQTQAKLAKSAQHAAERAAAAEAAAAAAAAEQQKQAQQVALQIAQEQAAAATAEAQATGGMPTALTQPVGGVPMWGWAVGGVALLGIGAMAMRRRS